MQLKSMHAWKLRGHSFFCNAGQTIGSLSDADRGNLKQQLRANLKCIQDDFADYIDYIQESLVKQKVSVKRLKSYLLRLPCSDENNLMLLSSAIADALEKAVDVYDIFMKLDKCTSFLNYHIFEKIVGRFDIDSGHEDLKYPEKLRKYIEKHAISEFIAINPVLSKYIDGTKKLVLLLDVEPICKFSKLVDIGQVVADIMNLDQSVLLIHSIEGGSVIITFLIPTSVAEVIFSGCKELIFSQEQKAGLRKVSVKTLKCNNYEFDFTLDDSNSDEEAASITSGENRDYTLVLATKKWLNSQCSHLLLYFPFPFFTISQSVHL